MGSHKPTTARSNPRILEWPDPNSLPPIPDRNFGIALLERMAGYGNDVAIIDAETGEQRTYAYLCEKVPRLAGGLSSTGVAPGDTVLLVSPNHIDFPLLKYALMYCGATFVPLNPDLKPDELCQAIRVSEAKFLVTHPSKLNIVEAAEDMLPSGALHQVWILTGEDQNKQRPSLLSLLDSPPIRALDKENGLNTGKIPAAILFSSGTTGPPKGVMISHRNLFLSISTQDYLNSKLDDLSFDPRDIYKKVLVIVPFCHSYGFMLLATTFLLGGTAVFLSKFSPKKYFEAIEKYKITVSPLVPHIANFVAKSPLLEDHDTSSVMAFSSAAAPMKADSINSFMERTGRVIAGGFGLTETLIATTNGGPSGFKVGSVGKVLPYVKIKVIDVDSGEILGDNEEGELCVQSPGVMLGYINNPQATRDMIDQEGWLHTGDIGYFDEDDFIFITDRMKDLIKVKGFQVSPSELETVLLSHDLVSEVGIIGVPHGKTGEAPRAYVVPIPGATLNTQELQTFVADRVAPYKQLTGGVAIVKSLPRNHTGKILRRQLKQDFLNRKAKL